MIKTLYGMNLLNSGSGFLTALIIGILFGIALEKAGLGSSRRLSGIFYFKDMVVLKVMFSALLTSSLGLVLFENLGLIDIASQIYLLKTYYGTHIIAGLIFGIGFVVAGWCPGTGIVGSVSGKIDAMVFLAGGIVGSIMFNELFPLIKPLYNLGMSYQDSYEIPGVALIYKSMGMSKTTFLFFFTGIGIMSFWGAEYLEKKYGGNRRSGECIKTKFLMTFSIVLISCVIFVSVASLFSEKKPLVLTSSKEYLKSITSGDDHIKPETLAELMYGEDENTVVIDVRPAYQYEQFHLRGALNIELPQLPDFVKRQDRSAKIILYSNGMTHPAQARDILFNMGFFNVFILTDGLNGFINTILKPISLRDEPLPKDEVKLINDWRSYFLNGKYSKN